MLLTWSSCNEVRSVPLSFLFHDKEGAGLLLAVQVKSTCSPSAPGIWVTAVAVVKITGRAVTNYMHSKQKYKNKNESASK